MEKEELIVCENQMDIDDLLEESLKIEEEEVSTILPEGFVIPKNHDWIKDEVLFVVVKGENALGKAYGLELCGKTVFDWVCIAGQECETLILECGDESQLISSLKNIQTDKKYIAVFYADTPLVSRGLFHRVMDYFCRKGMNALALPRGYVFKAEFIVTMDRLVSSSINEFDTDAFIVVDSAKNLSRISKYLYDKIRTFHLRNGVIMHGASTIFIDADVEIEAGAIIYPNNILRGQTFVGKNATLEPNNIISDSIISENASVQASFIEKSKISAGANVGPFEKLIGENR